jgi:hypothetical protein
LNRSTAKKGLPTSQKNRGGVSQGARLDFAVAETRSFEQAPVADASVKLGA